MGAGVSSRLRGALVVLSLFAGLDETAKLKEEKEESLIDIGLYTICTVPYCPGGGEFSGKTSRNSIAPNSACGCL